MGSLETWLVVGGLIVLIIFGLGLLCAASDFWEDL